MWCRNEHANAMWALFWIDEVCLRYKLFDGQMTRQDVLDLNWYNVEADTCIVLHVAHACRLIFNLVSLSNAHILTFWLFCFSVQITRMGLVVLRRRFCCCLFVVERGVLCLFHVFCTLLCRERSGSVVECLAGDRWSPGSSLTGVCVSRPWARTLFLALYYFNPRRPVPL